MQMAQHDHGHNQGHMQQQLELATFFCTPAKLCSSRSLRAGISITVDGTLQANQPLTFFKRALTPSTCSRAFWLNWLTLPFSWEQSSSLMPARLTSNNTCILLKVLRKSVRVVRALCTSGTFAFTFSFASMAMSKADNSLCLPSKRFTALELVLASCWSSIFSGFSSLIVGWLTIQLEDSGPWI